jgi:hypothetical protein
MASSGRKTSTRKVKTLKPKSVSGKRARKVKGGIPQPPPYRGRYQPQLPPV